MSKQLSKVFGDTFAEKYKQTRQRNWPTVKLALEADWTYEENDQPDEYRHWTYGVKLPVGDVLSSTLEIAMQRIDNCDDSDNTAVRKLARYGVEEFDIRYGDEITLCREYIKVISKIYSNERRYSDIMEKQKLDYNQGQIMNRKSRRIIWYQHELINAYSNALRAPKSDILAACLIFARDDMENTDDISPLVEDVEMAIEQRTNRIITKSQKIVDDAIQNRDDDIRKVISENEVVFNHYIS